MDWARECEKNGRRLAKTESWDQMRKILGWVNSTELFFQNLVQSTKSLYNWRLIISILWVKVTSSAEITPQAWNQKFKKNSLPVPM